MKFKVGISILLASTALGLGVGTYQIYQSRQVQWVAPKTGDIQEAIYGLGVVESWKVFEYKLALTSTISRVHVHEGDLVKKGQLLLQFHESPSLRAPFDGAITYFPFHEDENVFAQTVVLRLENLKDRYLEVTLEQQGALRVKKNQKARLSFESLRGTLFFGTVDSVYPSQGQFVVRIQPEALPEEILTGMTADVSIEVATKKNVLMIPANAVMDGKVLVLRDGKKEKIDVKLGNTDGQWIEVLDNAIQQTDQIFVRKRK